MKNKSIRILCAAVLCLAVLFSLTAFGTTASASAGPETYTIRFDLNTTNDPADDELYRYEESGYDENWQPVTRKRSLRFPPVMTPIWMCPCRIPSVTDTTLPAGRRAPM